jgi:Flp pilus assembly protein TadB
VQLRSALKELPGAVPWTDPEALRAALRPPVRALRNAAILAGTALLWAFWSIGMLVAFVAWLAANGPSLTALVVFPLLWFAASWLLWTGSKRRRSRG